MNKHTPTPWSKKAIASILRHANKHDGWIEGCGQDEYIPDQQDADLISAAPEIYASNVELAEIVREMCRALRIPEPVDALASSDAAIAKAKGEE